MSIDNMERVAGVEPASPAWEAGVIPIYDTRLYTINSATIHIVFSPLALVRGQRYQPLL